MADFIEYIEQSCKDFQDMPELYKYKKQILDEITERANQLTSRGLSDEKVLTDLIKDEYPNLRDVFKGYIKLEKDKKRKKLFAKLNIIGAVIFFILMFASYFTVSFFTHRWDLTWLIIVGGIFALIIYGTSFLIKKLCSMRRIFHPIARLLTAGCIMLLTVFSFLFSLMFRLFPHSWTVILGGIILMFVADGFMALFLKQKFRVINYLLYIPAISALLYVILGAYNVVAWSTGWQLIIVGILLDVAVIVGEIINNSRYIYKQEEEDEWNEN